MFDLWKRAGRKGKVVPGMQKDMDAGPQGVEDWQEWEAHQVCVVVHGATFAKLFERGQEIRGLVLEGLPAGAAYVRCFDLLQEADTFGLIFEHPDFAPVKSGDIIPRKEIVFAPLPTAVELDGQETGERAEVSEPPEV